MALDMPISIIGSSTANHTSPVSMIGWRQLVTFHCDECSTDVISKVHSRPHRLLWVA